MEGDRKQGLGKHLFEVLARIAQLLDCARFQWMVRRKRRREEEESLWWF